MKQQPPYQIDIAGGAATLPRLISVEEAAVLLAVTATTVRNWITKGAIPYIELPGSDLRKQYRIPLQALLTTLAGNYDLAGDLSRIDHALDGRDEEMERASDDAQREATQTRARLRGEEPVEVDGDPGDLFEHAQVSSD